MRWKTAARMATRSKGTNNCKATGLDCILTGWRSLVLTTSNSILQGKSRKAQYSKAWNMNAVRTWCNQVYRVCCCFSTALWTLRWSTYRVSIMVVTVDLAETPMAAIQPRQTGLVLLSCAVGFQYRTKIFGSSAFLPDAAPVLTYYDTSGQDKYTENPHNSPMREYLYSHAFSNLQETEVASNMFQHYRQIWLRTLRGALQNKPTVQLEATHE